MLTWLFRDVVESYNQLIANGIFLRDYINWLDSVIAIDEVERSSRLSRSIKRIRRLS